MRSALILGLLGASAVSAHPTPNKGKPGIRRRAVDLEKYRVQTVSEYINTAAASSNSVFRLLKRASYVDTATEVVKHVAPEAEFRLVDDHYVGNNGVAHVNFKQTAHGLDIDNADFNVNVGFHHGGGPNGSRRTLTTSIRSLPMGRCSRMVTRFTPARSLRTAR